MKTYSIAVLPGDGIGPEVIAQAVRVLEAVAERFDVRFTLETFPVGAAGVAAANEPLPQETRDAVLRSDAVLLGAVGDPALDSAPRELRPETGLLALRKLLNVYANLRPVAVHPALVGASPLKPERLRDVADWVGEYRRHWEASFDRLDEYLRELQLKEKRDDAGAG